VTCTETCTFYVTVKQALGAMWYRDFDGDGWGDRNRSDSMFDCIDATKIGWSLLPGDCDDLNPLVYRSSGVRYEDFDGDGYTKRVSWASICYGDIWPDDVGGLPGVTPDGYYPWFRYRL
jgi:hypothetical protein